MRIAYLVPEYPAVSHSFIRREIQALERQGFEIMRVSLRGWDEPLADEQDFRERERTRYVTREGTLGLSWAVVRMLFTRFPGFLRALALALKMSRGSDRALPRHMVYLAEACWLVPRLRDVQHVHAHFGTNAAEIAMLAHAMGGPRWSFTNHGSVDQDLARQIGLAEKIRRCAFAVAVSSFGQDQLSRAAGEDRSKVRLVHCGLEPAFHSAPVRPIPQAPRLVCIGRLLEAKGHLLLVEAAARLVARGTDLELVLVGDGDLRPKIEELAAARGLHGKVRITGWLGGERVREEILAARALVLASFDEGLPVVLMEAMALRRPVISTGLAGIPELVIPGENGWLVPAGDIDALVQAMQACLDASGGQLARMGEAARARVLERHDVDVEAAKLAALFRNAGQAGAAGDGRR
jgi:glycosyltransferase involved in cell wall biosynthesis